MYLSNNQNGEQTPDHFEVFEGREENVVKHLRVGLSATNMQHTTWNESEEDKILIFSK